MTPAGLRVLPLLGAGLGLVVLVGIVGLSERGTIGYGRWVETCAAAQAGLGILVALAVWRLGKERLPRGWMPVLLVFAVGFRGALFAAPYVLSEDAARYHWDGKVVAAGINPYRHVPEAPALDSLRVDELDGEMSPRSRRTLTVYPPLAQLFFAAAYLIRPGTLLGWHLLSLLAEIAAWLLLARELARRGLPGTWLLLVAWSPLLIFQGALSGHVDFLLLPFVLLFFRAVSGGRPARAGLWMGLLCLIKPLPVVLLPAAWRELGPRRALRLTAVTAATLALGYAPFLGAGDRLFRSLWLMAREWSFNGSVAALLERWLPQEPAHLVAGLLLLAAIALGVARGRDFLGRCLLTACAFAVFAPTLFPWYLVWILPFLALRPDPALLALASLAPLSELVMVNYVAHGTWSQPPWTIAVEYIAFYALLTLGYRHRWGMFGTAPGSEPRYRE